MQRKRAKRRPSQAIVKRAEALHQSLEAGDLERVRKLIASAKLKEVRHTLLHAEGHAAEWQLVADFVVGSTSEFSIERLKLLIQAGAPLDLPSSDTGHSAVFTAAAFTRNRCLEALLKAGANPNESGASGQSPLGMCVIQSNARTVQLLLEAGARVEGAANGDGTTALMAAVRCGRTRNIRLLVNAGANLHAEDAAGRSVLDFGRGARNRGVLPLLRELGLKIGRKPRRLRFGEKRVMRKRRS